jgi:futalosine hydrolase
MQVLLCAATPFEIEPTVQWIKNNHLSIDVLITGVGLTAATYQIAKKLLTQKPGFVLQAGVAGSLDRTMALGETVVVKSEFIGDLGVMEPNNFQDLFHLGLTHPGLPPYVGGRLLNPGLEKLSFLTYEKVNAVSVNEITTAEQRIAYYRQSGAQVESLEGAALHYTALMEDIPFLQMRSISNYVGERDKTKWILKEAIARLNKELIGVLDKLCSI